MEFLSLLLVYISCLRITSVVGEDVNYEDELRKYLKLDKIALNPNKALVRPVLEPNHTVIVYMGLGVSHITELDESKEILNIMVWRGMGWEEPSLAWNASKFGNIHFLTLPYDLLWKPDIMLLHETDYTGQNSKPQREEVFAVSGGWIYWFAHVSLMTVCPLDFQRFPFDEHDCVLEFGSYSHYSGELILNLMSHSENYTSDITYFLDDENNQWEVVRSWGQQNIYKYTDTYSWHTLEFHIVLRRRNAYFGLTLIMPMIMTMLLTLIGFWLPWDSTGRLTLGQINLVFLTILSAHLYWVIPRSGSSVPGIVVCCGNSMLFASFSMILTVICLKISRQTPSIRVPNIFRNVLQGIPARILGLGDGLAATKDGSLLNSTESSSSPEEEEEATSSKDETSFKAEWIVFVTALNRLAFYMFLIIYISILLFTFA